MRNTKIIKSEKEIVEDVICNKCGFSMKKHHGNLPSYDFYGLEAWVQGGYFSEYLEDGITYTFDICEKCLSKMFKGFVIQPKKEGYNGY